MKQWQDMLHKVLTHGVERPDRTGIGTMALFGEQMAFDNTTSFPAVTTKELKFEQVKAELACFIRGYSTLAEFNGMGCRIWNGNGNDPRWLASGQVPEGSGYLGRIYGVQWRDWLGYDGNEAWQVTHTDQLKNLVDGLRSNPYGRRHIVTAWNPGELDEMCLPPCHVLWQCFVRPYKLANVLEQYMLDLRVDLRSLDLFLGAPFDIASYALLQRLIAKECGMVAGRLTLQVGDCHVYLNHGQQVGQVLGRKPYHPPNLVLSDDASLFGFEPHQATLIDYTHHPAVSAPLNV